MKKIGLVIGESADLTPEIIEKHQLGFVSYIVDWGKGKDLPGDNIYQKMREADRRGIQEFPKTSQPSPYVFRKIFEEELKKSEKILCITLSSKLSGGYNSAFQAKKLFLEEEQKRIYVFDCLNVSGGEGLFVLKAIDLIEEGKEIEEVIHQLKNFIPKVRTFGMLGDPKWLEAGGRMSHTLAALVRQMAKIGMRPLVGVKKGVVTSVALKMQAKDIPAALFRELEKETSKERKMGKKIKAAICYADNLTDVRRLKEIVENNLPGVEIVFLNSICPVIGVHVGPGTLIISWIEG
jgi:DegV family protein with EDD domain